MNGGRAGFGPLGPPAVPRAAAQPTYAHYGPTCETSDRLPPVPATIMSRSVQQGTSWTPRAVDCRGTSARSSTDRASDYGSEGWGFESLRARQVRGPYPSREGPFSLSWEPRWEPRLSLIFS